MPYIIVIDDEEGVRKALQCVLEKEGFQVKEASNGLEGMTLQRERPADLVITDLIMPHQEGLETIKMLREEFSQTKIIAISGGGWLDADSYLATAKKIGADLVLSKPIDRKSLVEAVSSLLP